MTPKPRTQPRPLYARIGDEIVARIRSGEWRPGFRIPFEHQLMAQYGCARATANKAVQSLVSQGLVERRRRAGSFVSSPTIHVALMEVPDMAAAITACGHTYGYRLESRRLRSVDVSDPNEATLGEGVPVLAVACLHLADGRPFAAEDRVISLSAVPVAETADFSNVAPGAWLLAQIPWTEAEHRVSAMAVTGPMVRRLDVKAGSTALCVKRWTWRDKESITYMRQVIISSNYELIAKFSPTEQ